MLAKECARIPQAGAGLRMLNGRPRFNALRPGSARSTSSARRVTASIASSLGDAGAAGGTVSYGSEPRRFGLLVRGRVLLFAHQLEQLYPRDAHQPQRLAQLGHELDRLLVTAARAPHHR